MTIKKSKKRLFKKKINKPTVEKKKITKYPPKDTFFRKNEKTIFLILFPIILGIVFLIIYIFNSKLLKLNHAIQTVNVIKYKVADYPVIDSSVVPALFAKAAIVIDQDSKKVIFAKNPDIRFSMASTAKIMTALVAMDYYHANSVLTVRSGGIEGSGLGLLVGEQYLFDDLLYAMMLHSANDAAVAIVDNFPGGRTAFVTEMNRKARDLYLENTSFSDPAGLDDDGNFTTVIDLARLGAFAKKNVKLAEVVNTREKFISDLGKTREFDLENLNRFLGYKGVNGIKTGTTEGAGEVLVTSVRINDHDFIIVIMNSTDRFADTDRLLYLISENVRFEKPGNRN